MNSASNVDEQTEILKALIELRVIKRNGMNIFFNIEDIYIDIYKLIDELVAGNKTEKLVGVKLSELASKLVDELHKLQDVLNIGEI